jgi:hypothetical protein
MPTDDLDRLCVDTIRTLSMDAVQQAGSGHLGNDPGRARPGLRPGLALELVRAFAAARVTGEERHVRRLQKVEALESRCR